MAPTQGLVLYLAKTLPQPQQYALYTDNLFNNVPLAKALLLLNIWLTGTARMNASGFPPSLVQQKLKNKSLLWGSIRAEVVEGVLCFLWQDNSAVLGLTTAFTPTDLVIRTRRRPAITSTNARIVRPVFGGEPTKELGIPAIIDAYNHHMGAIDRANQLRASYSTQPSKVNRYWKPLFYWLLDIAITNSYLIFKHNSKVRRYQEHRHFIETLSEELMSFKLPSGLTERPINPPFIFETPEISNATEPLIEPNPPEYMNELEYLTTLDTTDLFLEPESLPLEALGAAEPGLQTTETEPTIESQPLGYLNPSPEREPWGVSDGERWNNNGKIDTPGALTTHVPIPRATRVICAYCRQNKDRWDLFKKIG